MTFVYKGLEVMLRLVGRCPACRRNCQPHRTGGIDEASFRSRTVRRAGFGARGRLGRGGQQEGSGVRRQRRVRFLEDRRGRSQEGPGGVAQLRPAVQISEQAAAAVQQRVLDDLVAAGVSGIMVSAVDPKNQTAGLDKVAEQTLLFTTDSDAPQSKRVAYIGSSNTALGKDAGKLMLKALPNGGKCVGFVGLLGADNARERIEGVKETIKGSKVELVDVRGDEIDQTRAKRNVEDILAAMPDVSCLVGFYSYNTPRIYEVLKEAGKLGQIKVIGFDEDPITLGGVKEGSIVGTVVQQPFEWGYQGMKLMAKYNEGDKSGIPANGIIIVPG